MTDLMENLNKQCHEAEIFRLQSTVNLVLFENSKLKHVNTLSNEGAAIRAMIGGKLGQAIVSDFRHPGDVAGRLRKLAELGDTAGFHFNEPATYARLKLIRDSIADLSLEEIIQLGQTAVDLLKSYDSNINAELIFERSLETVSVQTSQGVDAQFQRMYFSFGLMGELVEGRNILRIGKYCKGLNMVNPPQKIAQELVENLKIGRKNVPFKPGKISVVLAPSALSDVLEAFTGSVDADLVAKGVSPLKGRIGQQILDPRLTILDDPGHPDGIMSAPFDDEGSPAQRKAIIEKGVLKSYIGNLKAAAELGLAPTGNGFRLVPFERYKSFTENVSTEFSNLIMEPGPVPLESLRGEIAYGIEIHQINGILLGDLIGGDFSGSLEVAYLIRDGERVGRIKDAMISGNFFQLFRDNVGEISADREWSGTFGGCSGALLLPYVRIDGVEISGAE